MNIFLDTSVLYKDPFWKGNFFNELLETIKEKEINLYISNVVLMELEHNYKKIIEQEIIKLDKVNAQINQYNIITENVTTINLQESLDNLKAFYKDLVDSNTLKILDYSNDMLPEIVDRAIERKKPFTENKTELKDTIIWLTYAYFAERKRLSDCFLLTNNILDFCDTEKAKKEIYEIHSELQKDSNKFKVYKSPKDLIQSEKLKLQFVSQRFNIWLEEQDFSNDFVLELLRNNFEKEIISKIEREYESLEPSDIFDNNDYYVSGYVSTGLSFEIFEVDSVQIDHFNEECIVSGEVFISCDVEAYEYNSVRDPGEDSHRFYGETTNIVKLIFSFYYDQEETPRSINLENFEIVE
jgi:predicted nucleic acid-binding protein